MWTPSKEELRDMTKHSLTTECHKLIDNYMKVYDEYYDSQSRDSAFLKDLVDAIQGISAVLEVYTRDKQINSGYAIQKLEWSSSYINAAIKYFELKEKTDESNL